MVRTLIAGLAVAAVFSLGTVGSAFASHDDEKSISGYGCVPKKENQAGDFQYTGGSIKNVTTNTRKVVCPITRDGHGPNTTGAVFFVHAHVKMDASAETAGQSFDCTAEVRDVTTSTITDSGTATVAVAGNTTLNMGGLDYQSGSNDSLSIECTVPSKSRVRAYHWSEIVPTEDGE